MDRIIFRTRYFESGFFAMDQTTGNVVLGVETTGISLYTVNNCSVQGNIIEGNGSNEAGIYIHSSSARRLSDINVSGNQIKSGFKNGINTFKSTGTGFDRIAITDNRINNCQLYYIYLSAINVLKCAGNTISNDTVTMVAGGFGIRVDANENLLVSDNVLIGSPSVKLKRGLQSSNNIFGKITTILSEILKIRLTGYIPLVRAWILLIILWSKCFFEICH